MKVLLIIPPFTQLNTPYPSVLQLAGFLQARGYHAVCADLSIMVFRRLFSAASLRKIVTAADPRSLPETALPVMLQAEAYLRTVEPVVGFLSGKNPMLAHAIASGHFLPRGHHFTGMHEEDHIAFGDFAVQDRAKYYASLYIDDLAAFISAAVTPHFGLSRYAEKLAAGIPDFEPLRQELAAPPNHIDGIIHACTKALLGQHSPDVVGYTIPFPGNLLGALRSAQTVRAAAPGCKVVFGGGYVNTELRSITDTGIFAFADFLTFDAGELPLLHILENLSGYGSGYVRTCMLEQGKVVFKDDAPVKNLHHNNLPPPALDGISPSEYLSVTEVLNPMHRLWTDGYWHKLTIAHGCYWKKCTFCDVSLDYISRYSPAKAATVVDWMEGLLSKTGLSGFHFTDEAAPPALLRDIALEILRRGMAVTWWGNIRFEEAFTPGLCKLLAASGCVAVSGGLEVADDRLLALIQKGVTLQQTARVCLAFRQAGIFVHAYLMYGFPTQTVQEVINSLEMVRQFMEAGLFQSAYWHRFALTVHSPVAANREQYGVRLVSSEAAPFGNNDLEYEGTHDADYALFAEGLKVSLYNYMRGTGFNMPVRKWFSFPVPKPTVPKNLVLSLLHAPKVPLRVSARLCLAAEGIAATPVKDTVYVTVRGKQWEGGWRLKPEVAEWYLRLAELASTAAAAHPTLADAARAFPGGAAAFKKFRNTAAWKDMEQHSFIFY